MDYKLILVFVEDEKADRVLDAARSAGATGATVIPNAVGQGKARQFGLFGLEVLSPRQILLMLVEQPRASAVLDAVCKAGGLDESVDTGIVLELDVSRAVGLTEHIKELLKEHPLK
ncbi:nitrogen regulatory protein PII [Natronocella acetinitrilica]|uniref:Nitrogen regulatory protein PII n=1 Tax=Natronocella acetinitrilica TaxID=414046 RepID=A0AAE3G531_9GAMM|nr:P-II family nitrogen regulator [Natronocella acetinitrilica]MCP1676030.1 nitrogen regulatory protein PII [Natronocella acetinitrilica]